METPKVNSRAHELQGITKILELSQLQGKAKVFHSSQIPNSHRPEGWYSKCSADLLGGYYLLLDPSQAPLSSLHQIMSGVRDQLLFAGYNRSQEESIAFPECRDSIFGMVLDWDTKHWDDDLCYAPNYDKVSLYVYPGECPVKLQTTLYNKHRYPSFFETTISLSSYDQMLIRLGKSVFPKIYMVAPEAARLVNPALATNIVLEFFKDTSYIAKILNEANAQEITLEG